MAPFSLFLAEMCFPSSTNLVSFSLHTILPLIAPSCFSATCTGASCALSLSLSKCTLPQPRVKNIHLHVVAKSPSPLPHLLVLCELSSFVVPLTDKPRGDNNECSARTSNAGVPVYANEGRVRDTWKVDCCWKGFEAANGVGARMDRPDVAFELCLQQLFGDGPAPSATADHSDTFGAKQSRIIASHAPSARSRSRLMM